MFVSVIIPTYNRVDTLGRCLEHLSRQTVSGEDFEIIIVDDCSTDNTPDFCRNFLKARPNVIYHRNPKNLGLSTTRNNGIKRASGDLLVFLDNDLLVAPDYLEEIIKEHQKHPDEMIAVVSNITYPPDVLATTNFGTFIQSRAIGYRPPGEMAGIDLRDLPSNYFAGGGSSLRKKHALQIGLFEEDLKKYGSEDELFGYRFKRAGGRIIFCESARIIHHDQNVLPKYWRTKYIELGRYSLRTLAEKENSLIKNSLYEYLMPVAKDDPLPTKLKKTALSVACLAPVRVPMEWFAFLTDHFRALRVPVLYRYLTVAWMKKGFRTDSQIESVTY